MVTTMVGLHYSCSGVPPIVPQCVSARTWLQLVNRFCFLTAKLSSCGNCNPNFFFKHLFFVPFCAFCTYSVFQSPENPTGSLRRHDMGTTIALSLIIGIARLPTWLTLQQPNREPQQLHGTNLPLIALLSHQLIKYIKISSPTTRCKLLVLTHTSFSF